MLIKAYSPCYNDETTIGAVIKNLKPYVQEHYVLISEKPYFGEAEKPDRSEEIARSLGAKVIKGTWALDHFQRNLGQMLCKDADWILTFDSDELMCAKDLDNLIGLAQNIQFDAILNQPEVYWFNTNFVLSPRASYSPPIMCRPNVRFPHIRNIDSSAGIFHGTMHHLSWCHPKDIRKKVLNYAHANDFKDADKWYENEFLMWEQGKKAVMPDGSSYDVAFKPLPTELKSLF